MQNQTNAELGRALPFYPKKATERFLTGVVLIFTILLAIVGADPRTNADENKAVSALDGKEFVESSPPDATIDLETHEGVKLVAGEWRYSDTKIIEVDFKAPDKTPDKTYDYTPHAGVLGFDDSKWEVLDPTTLKKPRSTGRICFNWYRINLTIPAQVGDFKTAGSTVTFETTIDDYAEIWIDGILYRTVGQGGGSVIRGFNTPNRLIIGKNVQPGQHIQLAVFGINGPISAAPDNWIFMRMAHLKFYKPSS